MLRCIGNCMPGRLPRAGRLACGASASSLRCNVPSRHYTINMQGNVKALYLQHLKFESAACDAGPHAGLVINDINLTAALHDEAMGGRLSASSVRSSILQGGC